MGGRQRIKVARVYDDPGPDLARTCTVTLVTATRDLEASHAAVLTKLLS